MLLRWLLQESADVPADDAWLSPRERDVQAKLWAPKRRRDWRLGRWTAKRTLIQCGVLGDAPPGSAWERLSIEADEAGVPRVFVDGASADWAVSISHSGDCGLALAARRPAAIGCDVETIGRRAEEFVTDWFTERERACAFAVDGDDRSRVVTVIWSAKESALKALEVGLRLDTRQVEVTLAEREPVADAWVPLGVTAPARRFRGWWRVQGDRALTIVCDAHDLPVKPEA